MFAQAGGGGAARVNLPAATALRDYQLKGGYTPGPVFLFGLLAGIAGIFTVRRRRDAGLALACLLLTGSALAILVGADLYEFSWRYQLPALVTLPIAGAFGVTALARYSKARRRTPAAPAVSAPALSAPALSAPALSAPGAAPAVSAAAASAGSTAAADELATAGSEQVP